MIQRAIKPVEPQCNKSSAGRSEVAIFELLAMMPLQKHSRFPRLQTCVPDLRLGEAITSLLLHGPTTSCHGLATNAIARFEFVLRMNAKGTFRAHYSV
jgi:hypothetical protein